MGRAYVGDALVADQFYSGLGLGHRPGPAAGGEVRAAGAGLAAAGAAVGRGRAGATCRGRRATRGPGGRRCGAPSGSRPARGRCGPAESSAGAGFRGPASLVLGTVPSYARPMLWVLPGGVRTAVTDVEGNRHVMTPKRHRRSRAPEVAAAGGTSRASGPADGRRGPAGRRLQQQTVSRVLNDHPAVRAGTREAVLDAMRMLGYRPSRSAQVAGERPDPDAGGDLLRRRPATGPRRSSTAISTVAQDAGYLVSSIALDTADRDTVVEAVDRLLGRGGGRGDCDRPAAVGGAGAGGERPRTPLVVLESGLDTETSLVDEAINPRWSASAPSGPAKPRSSRWRAPRTPWRCPGRRRSPT
ncbi:hypothetical protein SALBM311S_05893 [Streptomyces alboniger]